MLGRQIRVEVSTSLGGRSGGRDNAGGGRDGRDGNSYRQRTDYNPVGEVSDDSWSRGEDFRRPTSRGEKTSEAQGTKF